jgi:hypothetical protein
MPPLAVSWGELARGRWPAFGFPGAGRQPPESSGVFRADLPHQIVPNGLAFSSLHSASRSRLSSANSPTQVAVTLEDALSDQVFEQMRTDRMDVAFIRTSVADADA